MRILHVIPYFTRRKGGDVNVCHNLACQQAASGHSVTVLTTDFDKDEELVSVAKAKGVRVVQLRATLEFSLFIYSPALKKWLRSNMGDYDIVHVHGMRSYQNIVLHRAAMRMRKPYVIQPHASTPRSVQKGRLKWVYDHLFGYRFARDAKAIIAISREEAGYDREMRGNDRGIFVVYNGVDVEPFITLPERGVFRKRQGIPENRSMLLYVGRLHEVKGLDFLVKSFCLLNPNNRGLELLIAGPDDGYGAHIQTLINRLGIEGSVRVLGFLDDRSKISAIRDCDLFLHTARYMGGVGLVPLEAILCETPVIVTMACGELISDKGWGYVVEYGNEPQLAERISQVLSDPTEGAAMARRGREYILKEMTWKSVSEQIGKIYESPIAEQNHDVEIGPDTGH